MGIEYACAVGVAAANAQWKSTIERGTAGRDIAARPDSARSKCPGCGSWELSRTTRGPVCSYCRVPAALWVSP